MESLPHFIWSAGSLKRQKVNTTLYLPSRQQITQEEGSHEAASHSEFTVWGSWGGGGYGWIVLRWGGEISERWFFLALGFKGFSPWSLSTLFAGPVPRCCILVQSMWQVKAVHLIVAGKPSSPLQCWCSDKHIFNTGACERHLRTKAQQLRRLVG